MILSVLIPSIPQRRNQLNKLLYDLECQIDKLPIKGDVEIISLIDNKIVTIGEKRERLKNMVCGKFFCFVDDDDAIHADYIQEIYNACKDNNVDVVYFDSWASIDGTEGKIDVSINNENEQFDPVNGTKRKPSHVNAWLTEKFKQYKFSDSMYGEDFDFCNQCYPHITSSYRIDRTLHFYTYDSNITEAFDRK